MQAASHFSHLLLVLRGPARTLASRAFSPPTLTLICLGLA